MLTANQQLPLRFFSAANAAASSTAKGFHFRGQQGKATLEEDVIDLKAERERRLAANPFAQSALKSPKKHKVPSQIDDSTYIYEAQSMKKM